MKFDVDILYSYFGPEFVNHIRQVAPTAQKRISTYLILSGMQVVEPFLVDAVTKKKFENGRVTFGRVPTLLCTHIILSYNGRPFPRTRLFVLPGYLPRYTFRIYLPVPHESIASGPSCGYPAMHSSMHYYVDRSVMCSAIP